MAAEELPDSAAEDPRDQDRDARRWEHLDNAGFSQKAMRTIISGVRETKSAPATVNSPPQNQPHSRRVGRSRPPLTDSEADPEWNIQRRGSLSDEELARLSNHIAQLKAILRERRPPSDDPQSPIL